MKSTKTAAALLLLWIPTGLTVGQVAGPMAPPTEEPLLSNSEFLASAVPNPSPPDVTLPPNTDLLEWRRDWLGRDSEQYVAPLIIPASDANGDGQNSDYFYSFGTGLYNMTDGCHMAPAYLPHGQSVATVTVDNFFIFALDNNAAADNTYNLWRKDTTSTSSPQLMATVVTSGASTSIQVLGDTSVQNAVVTSGYAYYVTWCHTGDNQAVLGFWIFYTES